VKLGIFSFYEYRVSLNHLDTRIFLGNFRFILKIGAQLWADTQLKNSGSGQWRGDVGSREVAASQFFGVRVGIDKIYLPLKIVEFATPLGQAISRSHLLELKVDYKCILVTKKTSLFIIIIVNIYFILWNLIWGLP
jgi:hypothetical protein